MDILLYIALTSLWICGFRAITDEGMILYFLRKPFEGDKIIRLLENGLWLNGKNIEALEKIAISAYDKKLTKPEVSHISHIQSIVGKDFDVRNAETLQLAIKRYCADLYQTYERKTIRRSKVIQYIAKPLVLCITCMGSVHGTICYSLLCVKFDDEFETISWVFVMLGSAFVSSFMWAYYDS